MVSLINTLGYQALCDVRLKWKMLVLTESVIPFQSVGTTKVEHPQRCSVRPGKSPPEWSVPIVIPAGLTGKWKVPKANRVG